MTEIKKNYKDVPIILVGTKDDVKQKIKSDKKQKNKTKQVVTKSSITPQKPSLIKQTSNTSTITADSAMSTATMVPFSTEPSSPPTGRLGAELVLAGQSLVNTVQQAVATTSTVFTPPPTPLAPSRPTRLSQSVSMISRLTKDELVASLVTEFNPDELTDDLDSVFEETSRRKDAVLSAEEFKKLLEELEQSKSKLENVQRYYTVYEFLDHVNGQTDLNDSTFDQA